MNRPPPAAAMRDAPLPAPPGPRALWPLTVVKIGGSLIGSPRLRRTLDTLAAASEARCVIVPGGGLFADAVREAQRRSGCGDGLAHRLALAAMGQSALLLAGMHPALAPAGRLAAVGRAHRRAKVPVWSPAGRHDGVAGIAESWDVTSDSLAAWLAVRLAADRLILVKSVDAPERARPRDLAACGLVDAAFPHFAGTFHGSIHVVGPAGDAALAGMLRGAAAAPGRAA
jgi:5-(aminomethyl)-3-furanmethanol phosphate kinase